MKQIDTAINHTLNVLSMGRIRARAICGLLTGVEMKTVFINESGCGPDIKSIGFRFILICGVSVMLSSCMTKREGAALVADKNKNCSVFMPTPKEVLEKFSVMGEKFPQSNFSGEEISWDGNCKASKADGYGVVKWDFRKVEHNNLLGTSSLSIKMEISGEFRDGIFVGGDNCVIIRINSRWHSESYKGQCRGFDFDGKGSYTIKDAVGIYANSRPGAIGELVIYEGMWKNGKLNGYGTWYKRLDNGHFDPTEKRYSGQWKNGVYHGTGTYTEEEENYRKGIWVNGVRPSEFTRNLTFKYTGEFKNGERMKTQEEITAERRAEERAAEEDAARKKRFENPAYKACTLEVSQRSAKYYSEVCNGRWGTQCNIDLGNWESKMMFECTKLAQ
jgi:hypothetical protein